MSEKMPNKEVLVFFADFPKEDPFLEELGAYVVDIKAGEVKLGLKVTPRQSNVHGIAHHAAGYGYGRFLLQPGQECREP